MALIGEITKVQKVRQRVQGKVDCTVSVFEENGEQYPQLDTYGSPTRALAGKASQILQFDRPAAEHMLRLIKSAFPDLH